MEKHTILKVNWSDILLCFAVLVFWFIQKQSETQRLGLKIFSGKSFAETIIYGSFIQPTILCQWLLCLQV